MNVFKKLSINFLVLFLPGLALSEELECHNDKHIIGSIEASAGTWVNLRNNKGSLRYETNRLLSKGLDYLDQGIDLKFSSVPAKFKTEYRNYEYCEKKLDKTSEENITFDNQEFKSFDEMQEWITEFSKGKGAQGEELYELCDKDCSPQYEYEISKDQNGLISIKPYVICGHARDMSDNMYKLSLSCFKVTK